VVATKIRVAEAQAGAGFVLRRVRLAKKCNRHNV
jgi:hypothetical protein